MARTWRSWIGIVLLAAVLLWAGARAKGDHGCDWSNVGASSAERVGSTTEVMLSASDEGSGPRYQNLDVFGRLWGSSTRPARAGSMAGTAMYRTTERVEVALSDGSVVEFGLIACA